MLKQAFIIIGLLGAFSSQAFAYSPSDGKVDIWPNIPFIRGADFCRYQNAYGQTRSEYMQEMVGYATDLMQSGALGFEALEMLKEFNNLYDRNQALALRGNHFDTTLESTLKSYIDSYYRKLRPRIKKINFRNFGNILDQVNRRVRGRPSGYPSNSLQALDFIAYGTYGLAPNCRGNLQVTLHLIGKDGVNISYVGQGKPNVVMSQIASQIFEDFQRTSFPSAVNLGDRTITLVGALNGSIATATSPRNAERACRAVNARLPNQFEIELLDSYGDWSGGVSLGHKVWAMPNNKVYHPGLRNPSPIRNPWEVNDREFYYYCVR